MKKSFLIWQFLGIVFTIAMGVLLHFLYELSGNSVFVAAISGVNESVWEHLKLIFFPMSVFALIEFRFFKSKNNFWTSKLKAILLGMILIIVMYYLYNGIIGKSAGWLNITFFVISVVLAYSYEIKVYDKLKVDKEKEKKSIFLIIFILALFILFTYAPLNLEIFKDPVTKEFGIK